MTMPIEHARRGASAPRFGSTVRSMERPRLGEILSRSGNLSETQLAEGLREQESSGERLGRCLLRLGHLSEERLLGALAEQLGLERVSLGRLKVPPEAARALPIEFVRRHAVIPLELRNGSLRIATCDPGDPKVIEDLRLLTGLEVEETLAGEREIREKIAECYQITVE